MTIAIFVLGSIIGFSIKYIGKQVYKIATYKKNKRAERHNRFRNCYNTYRFWTSEKSIMR